MRPGHYIFPGAPIARLTRNVDGATEAIRNATALGAQRSGSADLEFAIRQLVEVAVGALSPGINDPHTAISVLDGLGSALCDIAQLNLANGVSEHGGRPVLVVPLIDYAALVNRMFHMIRQNAAGSPAVLIRMLEVLAAVASCESDASRQDALRRHADLVLAQAVRSVTDPSDLADIKARHGGFIAIKTGDSRRLGSQHR